MKVLAIDVGGTSVKILATGQKGPWRFPSGPDMDPKTMVQQVKKLAADWQYDVVSIGIPTPFLLGHMLFDPHNLSSGGRGEAIRAQKARLRKRGRTK
jgi:polyphosphate glucokinase